MIGNIIAILPEEVRGRGICSMIYEEDGAYIDDKSPSHFLKTLYDKKGKQKKLVDKQIKRIYQVHRNIPYVIDANHVFFAFTVRRSKYDKETRGFVNVKYVARVEDYKIILTSGEEIAALNKKESLISNRHIAQMLIYEQMLKVMWENDTTIRYIRASLKDK